MQIKNDYQLDKILQRIKSLEREKRERERESTNNWELSKRVVRKDYQFILSGGMAPGFMMVMKLPIYSLKIILSVSITNENKSF